MTYFVRDEYAKIFGLQYLTLWSGAFASDFEGHATELRGHDGFCVAAAGRTVYITCPAPRTEENFLVVDAAINAALQQATQS